MADGAIHEFVARQRELLELELQCEEEEEKEAAGEWTTTKNGSTTNGGDSKKKRREQKEEEQRFETTIRNLEASEMSVGLYGRTVVTLTPLSGDAATENDDDGGEEGVLGKKKSKSTNGSLLLPSHRLTVGDEVEIISKKRGSYGGRPSNSKKASSGGGVNIGGVICELTETSISVALFDSSRGGKVEPSSSKASDDGNDNDDDILGPPPLSVVPRSSVEVHRKMIRSLDELEKYGTDHSLAGNVIRAVFSPPFSATTNNHQTTRQRGDNGVQRVQLINPSLDESQLDAIEFALNDNRPVALIHGPPGTGKTTTVAELIQQAVRVHKWKVLVTAPSNVAVDNVLERLVASSQKAPSDGITKKEQRRKDQQRKHQKLNAVRLGHPARIKPTILPYSLESLVQNADGTEIISDVRKEMHDYLAVISNPKTRSGEKRAAYREIRKLRKEIRTREENVVQDLLRTAQVILTTNVGAASSVLDKLNMEFDLVVIDEAAQALEASCWIPILRGRRLVLAGDHKQLPPTIKSNNIEVQNGLGHTMFERIMDLYGDDKKGGGGADNKEEGSSGSVSRMLRVQYRMHQDIADWASGAMYGGKLESHPDVRYRKLSQLPQVTTPTFHAKNGTEEEEEEARTLLHDDERDMLLSSSLPKDVAETTLFLIDTTGCDMHETTNAAGSRYNDGEAQIVAAHVRTLVRIGLKPEDVAVITPYNGQVELLRTMLLPDIPKLEIRSVDGFQGGEREAVVLSLVRSSDRGGIDGIGFLKDERRLNVAVTRAKRHCAVICDVETVSQSSFLKGLMTWMEEKGEYHSAVEFLANDEENNIIMDIADAAPELADINEKVDKIMVREPRDSRLEVTERLDKTTGKIEPNDEMNRVSSSAVKEAHSMSIQQEGGAKSSILSRSGGEEHVLRNQTLEGDKNQERKAIMDQVAAFAETGRKGDELVLRSTLSKFDRLVVHELAEQLSLGHRSEGVEGIDRRIILTVLKETKPKTVLKSLGEEGDIDDASKKATFLALAADEEGSFDSADDEDISDNIYDEASTLDTSSQPVMNVLLGDLARERINRQQEKQVNAHSHTTSGGGKKKKKKGNKLGGSKPAPKDLATKAREMEDELDDMAFLDAQIEKVQTSHGRKVEGSGKQYKTIVNGILLSRPQQAAVKRDAKASSALQAKLKEAQDNRKVKSSTKKKKK